MSSQTYRITGRKAGRRGTAFGVLAITLAFAFAGCSRSLVEYAKTTDSAPILINPALAAAPAEHATTSSVPPIALVPETGVGVATLGPEAAQLPADGVASGESDRKLLSPEEKARIIAELEALARRQSGL